MQDEIFKMLLEKDEITWQSLIYDLVRSEKMNPWDIDVSLLTKKYVEMVKNLKNFDFKISGKIVLAAAILVKIKSDRLLNQDIMYLDYLLSGKEESEEVLYEDEDGLLPTIIDKPQLIHKTPQPRKRKVSIYDLVGALQKALEVKKRRVMRDVPPAKIRLPERKVSINSLIKNIYDKVVEFFTQNENKRLTFTHLVPSESKKDKVLTFVPLLHLTNLRKVDLEQKDHFGEIEILLRKGAVTEVKNGSETGSSKDVP